MTPRQLWEAELKTLERDVAAARRKLAVAESAQEDDAVLIRLERLLDAAVDKLLKHQDAMPKGA
jgi:hypothetical protein